MVGGLFLADGVVAFSRRIATIALSGSHEKWNISIKVYIGGANKSWHRGFQIWSVYRWLLFSRRERSVSLATIATSVESSWGRKYSSKSEQCYISPTTGEAGDSIRHWRLCWLTSLTQSRELARTHSRYTFFFAIFENGTNATWRVYWENGHGSCFCEDHFQQFW